MWVQHTKPLLFPRPFYGSKLFRDLLFQVLLYLAIIGRPWPKLGGKLKKNEEKQNTT